MEISQLDWVFLKAKIESLDEDHPRQMNVRQFHYDSAKDRIVATVRVDRSWVEATALDKMRVALQSAAISYSVDVFLPIEEITSRKWSAAEQFKHFYVEFLTWGPTPTFRVFAVFEDGEIRWK